LGKDALGGGHIFFKVRLRFLDDADVKAVRDQDVVNVFPARTIRPRHQPKQYERDPFVLRRESAADKQL
jgi:hypothetical protein